MLRIVAFALQLIYVFAALTATEPLDATSDYLTVAVTVFACQWLCARQLARWLGKPKPTAGPWIFLRLMIFSYVTAVGAVGIVPQATAFASLVAACLILDALLAFTDP